MASAIAQSNTDQSKFRQLRTELPTPNTYRTASGAPGHQYWQQRADYTINVELNDENQSLTASETITYTNNSPDVLEYLWLQLDQNIFAKNSDTYLTETSDFDPKQGASFQELNYLTRQQSFDGGYKIKSVKDAAGKPLRYTINKTMMRVDLPKPLGPKQKFSFSVEWFNYINDCSKLGGRGGMEYFPEDKNYLYELAQWFPRMAVYDDVNGWQHKQYLGRGEFALEFGDYTVSITVPTDHIVASTGELQNADKVLTATQKQRWEQAKKGDRPVLIVTEEEAIEAEKKKASGKKTWVFVAKNVRDFAWASSRKFIWDAMLTPVEGKKVWAMSYYPKEGNPLWGKYSTEVIAHTLKVYSKFSVPYPYPVAISVNGPVGGMEYPMICFNGPRPEKDKTYSDRTKYGLITVIIHEVGHNFFPMIVSSDERQWSWMDEGLNTFLQYLTEQEWDRNYPSSRGEPQKITAYMKSDKSAQVPIMVNSESALQFGNNAYGKPATALNVLRETILGRELFDHAFRTYSKRWAFKHPEPADFFRTMEDASGTDLDWFWRGWFYTTDHVDLSIEDADYFRPATNNPEVDNPIAKAERDAPLINTVSAQRNRVDIKVSKLEERPDLKDFYNSYDPLDVSPSDKERYKQFVASLSEEEKKWLGANQHLYKLRFKNIGGLVMPVILKMEFADGSDSLLYIPAEIWRLNNNEVSKVLYFSKEVKSFVLDPFLETADCELENNFFPRRSLPSRFQLIKQERRGPGGANAINPMRRALMEKEKQKSTN